MSDVKVISRPKSKHAIAEDVIFDRMNNIRLEIIENLYEIASAKGPEVSVGSRLGANQTLAKFMFPVKKPVGELIDLNLPINMSLSDKAEYILQAGVSGEISPDFAAQVAGVMVSLCAVRSSDEFASRIESIETLLEQGKDE